MAFLWQKHLILPVPVAKAITRRILIVHAIQQQKKSARGFDLTTVGFFVRPRPVYEPKKSPAQAQAEGSACYSPPPTVLRVLCSFFLVGMQRYSLIGTGGQKRDKTRNSISTDLHVHALSNDNDSLSSSLTRSARLRIHAHKNIIVRSQCFYGSKNTVGHALNNDTDSWYAYVLLRGGSCLLYCHWSFTNAKNRNHGLSFERESKQQKKINLRLS